MVSVIMLYLSLSGLAGPWAPFYLCLQPVHQAFIPG